MKTKKLKVKANSLSKKWNYYLRRFFNKPRNWLILVLWLVIISLFLILLRGRGSWFFNRKIVFIEKKEGSSHAITTYLKINDTNDFFACVFPNLIFLPTLIWTFVFSPLSWIFWGQFDEVGQKTQTDGTDLFFLSTGIPTSRKQIFRRKVVFLTSFFSVLHLILFALPLSLLLWKADYFINFTALQTFLFLTCNFLIIPLFLFVPLVVLCFSLASLNSVWYMFLKWFGRLSVIFIGFLWFLVYQSLQYGGGIGEKILQWGRDFSNWLSQNYLLVTLSIMGTVIFLALFTLSLAYRDYKKKDLC